MRSIFLFILVCGLAVIAACAGVYAQKSAYDECVEKSGKDSCGFITRESALEIYEAGRAEGRTEMKDGLDLHGCVRGKT